MLLGDQAQLRTGRLAVRVEARASSAGPAPNGDAGLLTPRDARVWPAVQELRDGVRIAFLGLAFDEHRGLQRALVEAREQARDRAVRGRAHGHGCLPVVHLANPRRFDAVLTYFSAFSTI